MQIDRIYTMESTNKTGVLEFLVWGRDMDMNHETIHFSLYPMWINFFNFTQINWDLLDFIWIYSYFIGIYSYFIQIYLKRS